MIRFVRILPNISLLTNCVLLRGFTSGSYKNIRVEKCGKNSCVHLIKLNRPDALNALSHSLLEELVHSLQSADREDSIAAIVLTGSDRAFAAGADITEMQPLTLQDCYKRELLSGWRELGRVRKPLIAAVNGLALGGGCELALMCDVIYAGERAVFGQPEVKLGTIPGMGGSQRIPRAVGKSLAMELCLSGIPIDAKQALNFGLVSKVCEPESVVREAVRLGERIANKSKLIVSLCKEAVNSAYESSLQEGLRCERRLFLATFGTEDRKEGMDAFFEKRKPKFKDN